MVLDKHLWLNIYFTLNNTFCTDEMLLTLLSKLQCYNELKNIFNLIIKMVK